MKSGKKKEIINNNYGILNHLIIFVNNFFRGIKILKIIERFLIFLFIDFRKYECQK